MRVLIGSGRSGAPPARATLRRASGGPGEVSRVLETRPARTGVTLATRLGLATGLGSLALAGGLVLASTHHFLRAHEEATGREQTLLVTTAAAALEDALALAQRSLERTAGDVPVAAFANPLAGRAFLEARGALRSLFEDGLALTDPSGRVVAATG